ncbi:uncharacterized protein LOC126879896 [Diabrotica virgifera virgifera]|uniref:CHK kinase-like domain-containing protein n=1 Tax=Diabrotica virgifera virgifera TaxID=50390 RepID=A0ABM5JMN1_DIAVI|nr:uncharacterized protein LOC126879896 [Diabrotica virgifera virgifera]
MEIVEEHRSLLDRIASENGFTNYEIIASPGSNKGDNFSGIITAVTIKNKEKSLDLILKSSRTFSKQSKEHHIHVYKREIFMYERIFKEFKKYQKEHNIQDPFESVPKYYSSFTEEGQHSLVLENLKSQQYQLWDKKVPMNPEHIKTVLIEYAKFHAVSLAMKHKNPELFETLLGETNLDNPMHKLFDGDNNEGRENIKSFFSATLSMGYKAVKDDVALTEYLKKYESVAFENMSKMRQPEYKIVVTHGDCWCNNFMFKYQDPNDKTKPQIIRVIDWQISSFGNPCEDLAYFFVANGSEEVLGDFQAYLHVYHEKLSSQLRNFNLDPEEIFPFSTFENHLKVFILHGLFLALLVMKVTLSDADEIPEHGEEGEKQSPDEILDLLSKEMKNMDVYSKRIKIVMNFLVKNHYL